MGVYEGDDKEKDEEDKNKGAKDRKEKIGVQHRFHNSNRADNIIIV